jgi:hypothetical protein
MAEEPSKRETTGSTRDAWRELGEQFEQLGRSLAAAIRNTLEADENRRRLESLRSGVEDMASEVSKAIEEASASPEGQQVLDSVERTAENAVVIGQKVFDEARPHIISAMRQVNAELEKFSRRMEQEKSSGASETGSPKSTTTE